MNGISPRRAIRYARPLGAIVVLGVTLGGAAQAQQAGSARGLWLSGGIGMGFAASQCDVCNGGREGGLTANLAFGSTVGNRLALGIEGVGWRGDEGPVNLTLGTVVAVARFYPNPLGAPWYLSAGPGVLFYRADADDGSEPAITTRSVGVLVGVGYDLRVSDRLAITPQFDFVASVGANLEAEGESLTGVRHSLLRFGVALTFH
jgi:hypothetical protein